MNPLCSGFLQPHLLPVFSLCFFFQAGTTDTVSHLYFANSLSVGLHQTGSYSWKIVLISRLRPFPYTHRGYWTSSSVTLITLYFHCLVASLHTPLSCKHWLSLSHSCVFLLAITSSDTQREHSRVLNQNMFPMMWKSVPLSLNTFSSQYISHRFHEAFCMIITHTILSFWGVLLEYTPHLTTTHF